MTLSTGQYSIDWNRKMPKNPLLQPYNFLFVGGLNHSYSFVTDDRVRYEVRFVPSAYLFEEHLTEYIDAFEMIVAIADNPSGSRLPNDLRTAPTISAIFYDFFGRMSGLSFSSVIHQTVGRKPAPGSLPVGFIRMPDRIFLSLMLAFQMVMCQFCCP